MSDFQYPSWMGEYPRKGVDWDRPEVLSLISAYLQGTPMKEIAKAHGRTLEEIDTKLSNFIHFAKPSGASIRLPNAVQRLRYEVGEGAMKIVNLVNCIQEREKVRELERVANVALREAFQALEEKEDQNAS